MAMHEKEGIQYFVNKRGESFKIDVLTLNPETIHKVYGELVGEVAKGNITWKREPVEFDSPVEIDIMDGEELAAVLTCESGYFDEPNRINPLTGLPNLN